MPADAIKKQGRLSTPDALIDEALQHCDSMRRVMVGLRKSTVTSHSGRRATDGKSSAGAGKLQPLEVSPWKGSSGGVSSSVPHSGARMDQTLLPTSDAIQIACRAVDEITHALEALLHERLRGVFTEQAKGLGDLRAAVMQQLSDEASATADPSEAPSLPDDAGATMMRLLHDAGNDAEGETAAMLPQFERPTAMSRRQSWIEQTCVPTRAHNYAHSLPAGHMHSAAATSSSMSSSLHAFHPSASAIVVKQMERWKGGQRLGAAKSMTSLAPTTSGAPSAQSHTAGRLGTESGVASPMGGSATTIPDGSSRRPPSGSSSPKRPVGGVSTPSSVPVSTSVGVRPASAQSRRSSRRPTTSGGVSVDGVRGAHLPLFPYAHTPFPHDASLASWWHRVIHELQCGCGTTVLTLTGGAISQETAEVMLAEVSTEPPCLALLVGAVLSLRPDDSMLYLIQNQPIGATAATWKAHALSRQSKRLAVGSPILAARNSRESRMLLSERLQFATDRPDDGLLEILHRDGCKLEHHANLWIKGDMRTVASPARCDRDGVALGPLHLVPRPRGAPSLYFCTAGGAGRAALRGHTMHDHVVMDDGADPADGADHPIESDDMAMRVEDVAMIDVYPHIVAPTAYALCSVHPFHAGDAPRNWVFEGSADHGATWVTLRAHVDDATIGGVSDFAVFDVEPVHTPLPSQDSRWGDASVGSLAGAAMTGANSSTTTLGAVFPSSSSSPRNASEVTSRFCGSMFRVRNTGPNAQGNLALQVSALELYGRCLSRGHPRAHEPDPDGGDDHDTLASVFGCVVPTETPCAARMRSMQWTPFVSLPPPPAGGKGKAKGKGKK